MTDGDGEGIGMAESGTVNRLTGELEQGIALEKCRRCGCMKGALEEIRDSLEMERGTSAVELKARVEEWLGKTGGILYT
jgi:hypothetical protein